MLSLHFTGYYNNQIAVISLFYFCLANRRTQANRVLLTAAISLLISTRIHIRWMFNVTCCDPRIAEWLPRGSLLAVNMSNRNVPRSINKLTGSTTPWEYIFEDFASAEIIAILSSAAPWLLSVSCTWAFGGFDGPERLRSRWSIHCASKSPLSLILNNSKVNHFK